MESVAHKVLQVFADNTNRPVESLNRQTKLADIEISSLDIIEIVFHLEETFEVEIFYDQETGVQEFSSIDDVITQIEKLLHQRG